MTAQEIIAKVKELNWPEGSYVVFGSCPMALAGIREANDIDFLVSKELFAELKTQGWKQIYKTPNDQPLTKDSFEARGVLEVHDNWNFSLYNPTLEHLLASATLADGVSFAALKEVRKWKAAAGRPKDLKDVELIDEYLKKQSAA
jgi:hypothetical protein